MCLHACVYKGVCLYESFGFFCLCVCACVLTHDISEDNSPQSVDVHVLQQPVHVTDGRNSPGNHVNGTLEDTSMQFNAQYGRTQLYRRQMGKTLIRLVRTIQGHHVVLVGVFNAQPKVVGFVTQHPQSSWRQP